jgi:hypothetical protein
VERILRGESVESQVEARIAVPYDRPRQVEQQSRISEEFLEHFRAGLAVIGFQRGEAAGTYLLGPWESD